MNQVFRVQVNRMLEKHPKSIQQAVMADLTAVLTMLEVDKINLDVVALMVILANKDRI